MKSKIWRNSVSRMGFSAAAAVLAACSAAHAASGSWIYDGSSTWSTASRWNPAVVPGTAAGDVVSLTTNITASRTVTIDTTSRTAGTLIIGDPTSTYYNYTLAASGGAGLTFNNSGSDAYLVQTNNTAATDTISAPLTLADNLVVTNRAALTISGATGGAGKSLTKNGTGTLTLSGANTYSGGTTVNGGALTFLKTASQPGTGATAVGAGATLGLGVGGAGCFGSADLDALFANALPNVSLSATSGVGADTTPGSFTYGSSASGSRGFSKLGSNSLILTGANTYSGATTIYGGVLELESAGALPGGTGVSGGLSALVFNGGVLGLGAGDFTRGLASSVATNAATFAGDGGWAAFNADRAVNLGGSGATVSWGNPGFNGKTLILGAPTATHTVELQNPLNLGMSARTILVNDGAAAIDGLISAPITGQGNGNLLKTGSGTLALTAVNTYIGTTTVQGGSTLLVAGSGSIGTLGSNTLALGVQNFGAGTLQYASSATSFFSSANIGVTGSTGTLNQTNGVINVTGNLSMVVGADTYGFINLSGGTLAVGGALNVAQRGIYPATVTLSGSGVLTAGSLVVADFSSGKTSYGQFTQNGGTVRVGSLLIAKTSTDANAHAGTVDLNGGTFSTASIAAGTATGGGVNTSTFNFNGGTLKPTASSATFMQGLTAANVKEGGAVIDTDGYDITLAQALLLASGASSAPLAKRGAGTLTLTGTNTFTGPVTVNAGALVLTAPNALARPTTVAGGTLTLGGAAQLGAAGTYAAAVSNDGAIVFASSADQTLSGTISGSGSLAKNGAGTLTLLGSTPYSGATDVNTGKLAVVTGGALANSAVTLAAGATLSLRVLTGDGQWSCKSLTLGSGTTTIDFHFNGVAPSASTAPLLVGGALVNNGTLNVTVGGAGIAVGTYPLIRYTGALTPGTLGGVTLLNGGAGTLVNNTGAGTIDLSVTTAAAPLVWNGGTGDWDINTTANWAGGLTYLDGSLVLFDDTSSGAAPFTVTLPAAVSPNNVIFSNATKDYTLAGPGALAGEAGLFKTGAGALTLTGANTFSGGVTLDSGAGAVKATLAASQDSLGTGPVSVGSGATLVLDNTNTAAAAVVKANPFGGSGVVRLAFATNTTGRATALRGLSGFAGTVQVGSAGAATGDKLDASGAAAPGATVQIADGHTLLVGSDGAPVSFGAIAVRGAGNAEGGGALRMAANASSLAAPITLLGDTTLASDAAGATLSGAIAGTAAAGATNLLTLGTAAASAGCTLSGAIGDGAGGGKVALLQTRGTLTLAGANTYSGLTTADGGTLQIGADNALPVNGAVILGSTNSVGHLSLGGFSQKIASLTALSTAGTNNVVTIGAGQELVIGGAASLSVGIDSGASSTTLVKMTGGGALVITNAGANVTVGKGQAAESRSNTSALDLSELSSVILGSPAAPISELRVAYGQMNSGTLTLSNVSNVLTATTLNIGNSTALNAGSGTLVLGAGANVLAANTVNIGVYKAGGTVKFASQAAGSPGTVTIGGRTRSTADFTIGSKFGMPSSATPSGILDLRGHAAAVTAGTVVIGREDNLNAAPPYYTGGAAGSLLFDSGTFTATNLVMAYKSGVNTGLQAKATATLTVSGGVFTVTGGPVTLATQTGTGTANATLNLLGGTFRSCADILTGPSNCTGVITLDGGTLDMASCAIGQGSRTVTVFNARSGTLMNLGAFNNGAPLVKTGAGTLSLAGTNTYAGATAVSNGTLRLTGTACLPPSADLYLAARATVQLDYAGRLPIHALYVDGVRKMGSLYGENNLSPYLSGTGFLALPSQGTQLLLR